MKTIVCVDPSTVATPQGRMVEVFDDYTRIFDGPLYERSALVEEALRPLLPSPEDMAAEWRAHLHRSVAGVEVVPATMGRVAAVETRPGWIEEFARRKMFARLLVDRDDACAFTLKPVPRSSSAVADRIRSDALALSRAIADRIAAQVTGLRLGRSREEPGYWDAAAPILVHVHNPMPCIVGENCGAPLFFIDHNTPTVGVIFAAWYFITPVGVAPKEER